MTTGLTDDQNHYLIERDPPLVFYGSAPAPGVRLARQDLMRSTNRSRRSVRAAALASVALAASCSLFDEYEAGRPTEAECTGPAEHGNGLDDDNDGVVDEGCGCDFEGEERGVCALGLIAPPAPGRCERPRDHYAVEARLCDGLDNDCDGATDEGCPCSATGARVGVCALGRRTSQGDCRDSEKLEADESSCDGYDNDCDGATDEGCPICTYLGDTDGVCAFGQKIDDQTPCAPPLNWAEEERDCASDPFGGDLVDNDCDGTIDEGCACPFGDSGRGVCSLGIIGALTCEPPRQFERDETRCDGLDNDCDGLVDEECDPDAPPPRDAGAELDADADRDVGLDGDSADADADAEAGVADPFSFTAIGAGTDHTCVARSDGRVWCWGRGEEGQLGDGLSATSWRPRLIRAAGPGAVLSFGLGWGTSAWTDINSAPAHWGILHGTDPLIKEDTPTPVPAHAPLTKIRAGDFHRCGIKSFSQLWCWGQNNAGQLGDGTRIDRPGGVRVPGSWAEVDGGYQSSCALDAAGVVWCWGNNSEGQLGDGTTTASLTPVDARLRAYAIAVGDFHACAIGANLSVHCWGKNHRGQVGDGTTINALSPTQVAGSSGASAVSAGWGSSCMILSLGGVSCWGANDKGQVGDGTKALIHSTPQAVTSLPPVISIAVGGAHACAITRSDAIYCWGDNQFGQLGSDPALLPISRVPVLVSLP